MVPFFDRKPKSMLNTTNPSPQTSEESPLGPRLSNLLNNKSAGGYRGLVTLVGSGISEIKGSLGIQFYYGLGMAVQKGTPFLILPLLIYFYGDHTYASYVLFYTTVQIFGVFCSLAIPSSTVVFWYRRENKQEFLVTYFLLLSGAFLVGAAVCIAPMYFVYKISVKTAQPLEMALLGVAFVGLYTFNQYFVSLYRATYSSKKFFIAQIIGAIALLAVAIPFHPLPLLSRLIWAFLVSLLVQDLYLLYVVVPLLKGATWHDFDLSLARSVLAFSLPLVIYNSITLLIYWIDKFMVSMFFDPDSFSKFVVTFQFAFAQAMISQLFALYNFPRICELVAEGNYASLRMVIRTYNLLMLVLGIAYSAAILIAHAYFHVFHISVSGFIILSLAFLLSNLSTTYLNVLYAHTRTRKIVVMQAVACLFMLLVLTAGCLWHQIAFCYASHVVAGACVLFLFGNSVKRISGATLTPSLLIAAAVRGAPGIDQ
jgi:O-antigen/teichoic acid export membrane protein